MSNPQIACMPPDGARRARRYAKTAEAAALIGVTTRTIRAMIADGRITAYRNGSRIVRIDLDELEAAMQPTTGGKVEQFDRKSKTDEYIDKLLAEAPPLSDEQRARLAELLAPVRGGGANA